MKKKPLIATCLLTIAAFSFNHAYADETCQSPYMAKIIGQEDFV